MGRLSSCRFLWSTICDPFVVVLLLLGLPTLVSGEDLSQFLYLKESPASVYPVQEYKRDKDSQSDTQEKQPDFLYQEDYPHPRVVEFYAHWCHHCQHFKPKYIEFAKDLLQKQQEAGDDKKDFVQVFAISCVPNRNICSDSSINGYPTVKLFPAFSNKGETISQGKVYAKHILKELGLASSNKDKDGTTDPLGGNVNIRGIGADGGGDGIGKVQLGVVKKSSLSLHHFTPRTMQETMDDAMLSFEFVLRTGIFTSNGSLESSASIALKEFLQLATKALRLSTSSSNVSAFIDGLWKESSTIVQSNSDLIRVLDSLPHPNAGTVKVAGFPNGVKGWSPACLQHGTGYTCGLWTLFHLLTVGSVEWNKQQTDPNLRIPTMDVAERIRNFIEHFFQCDECRVHFLKEYDSCGHDRCNRLSTDQSPTLEEGKQLVLWLYETHNGVNIRLRGERIENQEETEDMTDESQVQWPTIDHCPICWLSPGRWDEDYVYQFIRMQYWPEDDETIEFKKVLLQNHDIPPEVVSAMAGTPTSQFVPSAVQQTITRLTTIPQFLVPLGWIQIVLILLLLVCAYRRRRRLSNLKGYHNQRRRKLYNLKVYHK